MTQVRESLEQCAASGGRVWLYAGSVQALLYNLYNELKQSRQNLSIRQCMQLAKHRLADFAGDKHWLAALAGEGDVIDLKTQQDAIRPELEKGIHRVLHHGQYIMGPEVKELETRLAEYVGVKHAISCSNGTDGLPPCTLARPPIGPAGTEGSDTDGNGSDFEKRA
jgi:hypothetical protein